MPRTNAGVCAGTPSIPRSRRLPRWFLSEKCQRVRRSQAQWHDLIHNYLISVSLYPPVGRLWILCSEDQICVTWPPSPWLTGALTPNDYTLCTKTLGRVISSSQSWLFGRACPSPETGTSALNVTATGAQEAPQA